MKTDRINDEDRRQWIESDEGLYDWQQRSRLSMQAFIKQHRADIDAVIRNVRDGVKPAQTYHHGPGCPCARCRRTV